MLAKSYHDPDDEPTAPPLDPSFFDFDGSEPLGKEDLKGAFSTQTSGGWRDWLTRLRSNSVDLQRSHERAPVPTAAADTDTFAGRADEWRLESYGVGVVSRTGRTRTATDTVGETEAEQGRRVRDTI